MFDILNPVDLGRIQLAFTAAAHIVFPTLTIGLDSHLLSSKHCGRLNMPRT